MHKESENLLFTLTNSFKRFERGYEELNAVRFSQRAEQWPELPSIVAGFDSAAAALEAPRKRFRNKMKPLALDWLTKAKGISKGDLVYLTRTRNGEYGEIQGVFHDATVCIDNTRPCVQLILKAPFIGVNEKDVTMYQDKWPADVNLVFSKDPEDPSILSALLYVPIPIKDYDEAETDFLLAKSIADSDEAGIETVPA